MSKSKFFTMLLALLMALVMGFAVVGCTPEEEPGDNPGGEEPGGEEPGGEDPGGEPEETYTVTFMDGDTVVYQEEGNPGEFVDIPDDPTSSDPRITFEGWEGLSDSDYEAGKVEIFYADQTYTANWYEMFGTTAKYTGTRVGASYEITVDGTKDEAYADATAIPVEQVVAGDSDVKGETYFMYDSSFIYIFVEVTDANVDGTDRVELRLDTLHDDSLASAGWTGGWGGGYRGEPGPMVEAGYIITAGTQATAENRTPSGSDFYFEWWSNESKNDGVTFGTSNITDTGYTVEYRISTTIAQIADEYKPTAGKEIGFGVQIFDGDNRIAIDNIADYNSGPKKISNLMLQANANDDKVLIEAQQVRDTYNVTVDGTEDLLYKDATAHTFGASTLKLLWAADGVYAYADLGETTQSFTMSGDFGTHSFTTSDPEYKISGSYALSDRLSATISYQDGDAAAVSGEYLIRLSANASNLVPARNLYEIEKVDGSSIVVDGTRDAIYGDAETLAIETISAQDNASKAPAATGKAWIVWDDGYLYVFVEVYDDTVTSALIDGKTDYAQYDSVELWLSTCRTLPTASTGWGDANRPSSDYCGEGGWRVVAGNVGPLSGSHWMYDWADGVPRECTSVLTDTGYTVEYKIAWSAFAGVKDKVGEIVDMMININDDDGDGAREGVVSANSLGQQAWVRPYVLDHFKLVDNVQ